MNSGENVKSSDCQRFVNSSKFVCHLFQNDSTNSSFLVIYPQHFIGRRRNCYSIAIRNVHRALVYATKARALKKNDMKEVMKLNQFKLVAHQHSKFSSDFQLWDTRITAGCEQFGIERPEFREALLRSGIQLDR